MAYGPVFDDLEVPSGQIALAPRRFLPHSCCQQLIRKWIVHATSILGGLV
jgi:hypothetical protein